MTLHYEEYIDLLDFEGSLDDVIALLLEWKARGGVRIRLETSGEPYDENVQFVLEREVEGP